MNYSLLGAILLLFLLYDGFVQVLVISEDDKKAYR